MTVVAVGLDTVGFSEDEIMKQIVLPGEIVRQILF
jgi:hypothetical protein